MNPQHRPLTQELVQMAMAKTAERVALIEESERQRGLPPTTKVASDETDESIGTDFAEKLASAVEFILPEVQAKEAGALDSVGKAIRGGAFDVAGHAALNNPGRVRSAIGRVAKGAVNHMSDLTDSQIGGRALATGAGLAAVGAGGAAALHHKQAGAKFDKAKDAVKGLFASGKDKARKASDAASTAVNKAKGKALTTATDAKDAFKGNKLEEARKVRDEAAEGMERRVLQKDVNREALKTHGSRAAAGLAAAGAVGGAGYVAHKKLAARFSGKAVSEAKDVAAKALPDSLRVTHAGVVKAKATAAANAFKDAFKGHEVDKLKDMRKDFPKNNPKNEVASKVLDSSLLKERLKTHGARGAVGGAAAGVVGGAALAGKKIHDKSSEKKAEDAINPAHISGKASPLAAAPVRTETGQDGPSAQGNTGALSSNAAAIAFSNAKNQGMKAEQLRKYFSNAASSQHGDPALTKNFAHKTASDKVAEAQHILSALAAQVEGK